MGSPGAAVIYTHSLFGDGIARLLARDWRLDVVCVARRCAATEPGAGVEHAGVIVVEDDGVAGSAERMLGLLPPVLVVFVSLGSNRVEAFRARARIQPEPLDLSAALALAVPSGRSPVA